MILTCGENIEKDTTEIVYDNKTAYAIGSQFPVQVMSMAMD
jgi:hypothetical protein